MPRCSPALIVALLVGCSQDTSSMTNPTNSPVPTTVEVSTSPRAPSSVEVASVGAAAPSTSTAGDTIGADAEIAEFLEGSDELRVRLATLVANPSLPVFSLTEWYNSEPLDWAQLEGKLVLLDFWATWCGPCIRAVPHTNELAERYAGEVVIIGVCAPKGAENLAETIEEHFIQYPVAVDTGSIWNDHFGVNGFPDYYVIGRDGELLAADIANSQVDAAIEYFLNR